MKTGLCYKCGGSHFECKCTSKSNNKLQNKTTTQQMQKSNYTNKSQNNKTSNNMFLMGTLSFQMSKPIRSSKDMSVSIDTIKCSFCKIAQRYRFKKKSESQHEDKTSSTSSVNEVMEAVMACE